VIAGVLVAHMLLGVQKDPAPSPTIDPCQSVLCRPAGGIDVRLDKETGTTVSFPPMPYAFKNAIYVRAGDEFSVKYKGLRGNLGDGEYVPSEQGKPPGLHLRLWQEDDGSTILAIENTMKATMAYDVAMQLPRESKLRNTTALPIRPGLTNYEHWPHPVAQLLLYNVRLKDE